MALIQINADFSRMAKALEDIALSLKHALRIFESAFPLQPAEQFNIKPSDKIRIVDDDTAIEREREEQRKRTEEDIDEVDRLDLDAAYDLDPTHY